MHVLMLNHNVIWRSTFYRAFYFARELVARGHRVTVATISQDRVLTPSVRDIEGVTVVETPDVGVSLARTGWDPWDSLFRIAYFQRERFDVVHGFDCRPVVLAPSLWMRTSGIPWVSDWADWWGRGGAISERKSWIGRVAFAPLETFLEERFRWLANQVTVTSRALYERCTSMGLRRERVHYLPSGANVRTIRVRDRAQCRRELELPLDAPIACFVGFVQYDLELVVRSFAVVKRALPEARLVLVGPPHKESRALIAELGLSDAVIDVGA
ncbi:MAG TPA: glycosyltransferase, partial [Polyangiales bacterium]